MSDKKPVYDSNMDSRQLDDLQLGGSDKVRGIILLIVCSAIGIFVFFGSVTVDGESSTVFSLLYNGFVDLFGDAMYWILAVVIVFNLVCHIYYHYVKKDQATGKLADTYNGSGPVFTALYLLGLFYMVCYALYVSFGLPIPEIIVGDATGGNVIPPIVKGVFGIILVGAVFMPLLLNYGVLEIIGAILEPLMRPVFRVPGKSALDATASFVSSSSLGVLITNRLWKQNVYTDREMVAIMTGFSAVSIGFASLVISTAGLGDQFAKIYIISFVMVFLIEPIIVRIPPVSRKPDRYYDGRQQTEEDRKGEARFSAQTLPRGLSRAWKRAAISKGLPRDIWDSLKDGVLVLPQVMTMLSAVGVSAMILAEYTPIFTWLGYIFQPLLMLCQIDNAGIIAASMPVGLMEMMLPVLVMNSSAAAAGVTLSAQTAAFVCLVSMVQIIFFSETATVMMATNSPIKVWEIVVVFLERTIVGIFLAAIAVHIFF